MKQEVERDAMLKKPKNEDNHIEEIEEKKYLEENKKNIEEIKLKNEKKIKNLSKKIKQIEFLEQKNEKGLSLTEDENEKIKKKGNFILELKKIKDEMTWISSLKGDKIFYIY